MAGNPEIAVIGLGYVGLPLAAALAKTYSVTGFDLSSDRISELRGGHDRTGELSPLQLNVIQQSLTDDIDDIRGRDIYIVAVPTPVDEKNQPDLRAVTSASETVGKIIGKGAIAVFESTVYPGVTEDVCGPAIERVSGLKCGTDFFLGYSPERINPGDKIHTVDKITKIVAGQTSEVSEILKKIYGSMNNGDIFVAASIRAAEAAKVIENAQRDINIAFVNEVAMIFDRMNIPVQDVLQAAGTKWNFLDFKPGLVGGHCIGVDPFYLAHAATANGHDPEIILSGRRINDGMSEFLANRVSGLLKPESNILVLGLTFKENVPDLRNSQVAHVIKKLEAANHSVTVHDPHALPAEADKFYGVALRSDLSGRYDCILSAVAHSEFTKLDPTDYLMPGGLIADFKSIWPNWKSQTEYLYWSL